MTNPDILMMLGRNPSLLPLYELAEEKILTLPDVRIKAGKTQVGFYNRHLFAALWTRKNFLGLSFGLGYRLEHPRITESVEPYPNRWTHHVHIREPGDIDEQLMAWLREAYDFALNKGRAR